MQQAELVKARGHVKWFDTARGYGFIVDNVLNADVLVHSKVLRTCGYNPTLADGALIECTAEPTGHGLRAIEVLSVDNTSMQRERAKALIAELAKLGANVSVDDLARALRECGFRLDAAS